MELKLITEQVDNFQILEAEQSKDLYVKGIFSSAEAKNKNGRIYTKKLLEKEVSRLLNEIKMGALWGELNHPPSPEVNLERAAILVESLEWKGNDVLGKAAVVDTPLGNIVKALMKKGKIGISSRGLGSVKENGYVDSDTYKLITWDIVGNPSNYSSWINGIYEGQTWSVNDIGSNIAKEAVQETLDLVAEDKQLTKVMAQKIYGEKIKQTLYEIAKNL